MGLRKAKPISYLPSQTFKLTTKFRSHVAGGLNKAKRTTPSSTRVKRIGLKYAAIDEEWRITARNTNRTSSLSNRKYSLGGVHTVNFIVHTQLR